MAAKIELTDDTVLLKLEGISGIASLKTHLELPLSHVSGARTEQADKARAEKPMFRFGTHIPGLITAGSYGSGESKQFWYVEDADRLLVIDLRDEKFARVVVQVDDPENIASQIEGRINGSP